MRWLLILVMVGLVACGGETDEGMESSLLGSGETKLSEEESGSPSESAQKLLLANMRGEASVAWNLLHPAQQQATTQATFTGCWGDGVDIMWSSIDIEREPGGSSV